MKKVLVALICTALVLSGCGNMSNLAKGTAIGGGSGAARARPSVQPSVRLSAPASVP